MTVRADVEARTTVRSGLGDVARALEAGPSTIAFMGASVTVQRDGYRPRLHELIQRRFPHEHRSVHASVGGVGAVSAIFLMDWLVLPHRPRLCLVEYSSADFRSRIPLELISGAVDGIVAKLRAVGCTPFFVHLYRSDWDRRCEEVVATWEEAADRWGVPSIDAGAAFAEAIAAGGLTEQDLLKDALHTTAEGSALLASLIARSLDELFAVSTQAPTRAPRPAGASGFENARILPAELGHARGPAAEERFRMQIPYLRVGQGVPIEFVTPGELVGLVVLVGPDSGEIRVTSDSHEESTVLFDSFSAYQRLSTMVLRRRVPAGSGVSVELTDREIDRTTAAIPIEDPEGISPALRVAGYMVVG